MTWAGGLPGGDYDSRPLLVALRERGLHADIRAWNDPAIDWSDADITVIRSTWDYHHDLAGFLDWIDRAAAVTALHNPPLLIRWNTDKRYLLDLERSGIAIVPTLAAADPPALEKAIAEAGWTDVVLKPAVSLDGHGVYRAAAGTADIRRALDTLGGTGTLIAQPFVDRIILAGELSLAFIDGRFSHAVRKRPAPGEFRVQERLGGTVEPATAPPASVAFAAAVLDTLDEPPLYARVDIIEGDDSRFMLTELELVEPSLFLASDRKAAGRFAHAIEMRVART